MSNANNASTEVTDDDIRALAVETQGNDGVQVALCHIALGDNAEDIPEYAREALAASPFARVSQETAWSACKCTILAARSAS